MRKRPNGMMRHFRSKLPFTFTGMSSTRIASCTGAISGSAAGRGASSGLSVSGARSRTGASASASCEKMSSAIAEDDKQAHSASGAAQDINFTGSVERRVEPVRSGALALIAREWYSDR